MQQLCKLIFKYSMTLVYLFKDPRVLTDSSNDIASLIDSSSQTEYITNGPLSDVVNTWFIWYYIARIQ